MITALKNFGVFILLLGGILLSASFVVPAQRPVDEFGYGTAEASMARLDAFFGELQNAPGAQGYIVVYGSKAPKKGEIEVHFREMLVYFTARRFPKEKITFINGGYRDANEVTLAFWIAAPGESAPKASNVLDIKQVKFQRGRFRGKSLYMCC